MRAIALLIAALAVSGCGTAFGTITAISAGAEGAVIVLDEAAKETGEADEEDQ